jgi:hypothetical protein
MKAPQEGTAARVPWNKGRLTGQKPPLKLKEIWAIRIRLQLSARVRDGPRYVYSGHRQQTARVRPDQT